MVRKKSNELTRRSLLKYTSVSGIALSSGCLAPGSTGETTNSASSAQETESDTEAQPPSDPSSLAVESRTLEQQSTESPARFEVSVSNQGARSIPVRFGPALLFTDNADESLNWADDLVIIPESDRVGGSKPFQTDDGCWRFPTDGYVPIQSILETRTIPPDGAITESYRVYTRGKSLRCLPPGEYKFQDKMTAGSDDQPLVLSVIVTVSEQQNVSTSAQMELR